MNEDKILSSIAYRSDQIMYKIEHCAGMVIGMIGIAAILTASGTFGSVVSLILSCSGFLSALRSSKLAQASTKRYYEEERSELERG